MSYTHFGKPADVWKHSTLCEIMKIEAPEVYVESNSASALYTLTKTPEQEYGIYHFIDKAPSYRKLYKSIYYELESQAVKENRYLGSPALAMAILENTADKFIFFDIEKESLENIVDFSQSLQVSDKVETINQESIEGLMQRLDSFPENSLIHIDPYEIDKDNEKGYNYLDVFIKAIEKGLKCFLWYGYHTMSQKNQLNDFIATNLASNFIENVSCTELIMEVIHDKSNICNPGIIGNGILAGNLSENSLAVINTYSKLLVELYKGSKYKGCKGDMYRDVVRLDVFN